MLLSLQTTLKELNNFGICQMGFNVYSCNLHCICFILKEVSSSEHLVEASPPSQTRAVPGPDDQCQGQRLHCRYQVHAHLHSHYHAHNPKIAPYTHGNM